MRLRRLGIAIALGIVLSGTSAAGCPYCKTAEEVRRGIFDESFASNLGITVVPFVVFLGITVAIHRFPRPKAASPGGGDGGR